MTWAQEQAEIIKSHIAERASRLELYKALKQGSSDFFLQIREHITRCVKEFNDALPCTISVIDTTNRITIRYKDVEVIVNLTLDFQMEIIEVTQWMLNKSQIHTVLYFEILRSGRIGLCGKLADRVTVDILSRVFDLVKDRV
jgi:hypothetical protein